MKQIYLTLIPSSLLLAGSLLISAKTFAQVTSDNTLSTIVTSADGSNFTIEGGNRPNGGGNLFHSFQDFSVPTNGSAVFNNANDIANIISRVTGGNFSNIDGLIKANGSANLFLINPAGILFGENARLDIGGSFFGSTANSLLFPEGEFSAVDTQAEPLLTINIPIGLRFRDNPQPIANLSSANGVGLQVKPEQTLALMGGDLFFIGGKITAPGSNIELGGLISAGTVTIDDNFKFGFPEGIDKADVSFTVAEVNVASDGGGTITINAGNIEMEGNSQLLGGIAEGLGNANSQAGDINLNATGAVTLTSESSIQNTVSRNAVGNSSEINVSANSLTLENGSFFSTSTFGLGNGGDININVAEAVSLDGVTENQITRFASVVSRGARGNAGDINITAGSLALNNGAWLNSRVSFSQAGIPGGIGNGGDININVKEAVTISGFSQEDNIFSQIISRLGTGAEGSAGDINIKSGSLFLKDGGFVSGSIFGQGSAGNINIDVEEAVMITNTGGIFSTVAPEAIVPEEERSTVTIRAGSLSIADANSQINTSSFGIGDAGNIYIEVGSLSLEDGSFLISDTFGLGDAGNINVMAKESINFKNNSRISNGVFFDAIGQGGQITLTAKSVSLSEASFISTSTFSGNEQSNAGNIEVNVTESLNLTGDSFLSSATGGQGDAGNITINGKGATILIQSGENLIGGISSSNSATNATGNAGDINITGRSLSLENGGFVNSNTFGNGNAGNITVFVDETISFANNSRISSLIASEAVGQGSQINVTAESISLSETSSIAASTSSENEQSNGGNIEINVAESLTLTGGSFLNSATSGKGNAGNITINGEGAIVLIQGTGNIETGSSINNASNGIGNAGNISITGRSISLEDGGSLSSNSFGQGLPGNITLDIEEDLTLVNSGSIASFAGKQALVPEGENSTIQINAGSLFIAENGSISTFSSGTGNAGDVVIDVDENFKVVGGFILSNLSTGAKGKAGDINIQARTLSLKNGAFFDSSSSGQGDSGIISISTDKSVTVSGAGTNLSNIIREGGVGNSQGISIQAESLFIREGAQIQTLVRGASEDNPAGVGNAGTININTSNSVNIIDGSIRSSLGTEAEGRAGDINIKARSLSLENGAILNTSSFGKGDSGIISISTDESVTLSGVGTSIRSFLGTEAEGNAGNIDIRGRSLFLDNGARLRSSTFGKGDSGLVSISTNESVMLSGAGTTIFNNVEAGGVGNSQGILIEAESLFVTEGAQIQTLVREGAENSPAGVGNAGNVNINVRDTVDFSGVGVNSEGRTLTSQVSSALQSGAKGKAGNINITARSLLLDNGARLINSSFGIGDAGDITLDIQDDINLSGFALNITGTSIFPSAIISTLGLGAEGEAGDISIKGRSLLLENRGQINNTTFGIGDAGDININVDDSVNLFSSSLITNNVGQRGVGNGGDLNIQAKSLTLREGSQISAVVSRVGFNTPGGTGTGGDLRITTTDFIDIAGVSTVQLNLPDLSGDPSNTTGLIPTAGFSSGLFAATQRGATGEGGSITVTTDAFRLADGAVVDNSTTNNSNAGDITINANTFEAISGGQVITATRGNGKAADIKLNITDRILISGSDPNFAARLARAEEFGPIQGGDNIVTNQGAASGVFANTSADSTGRGGNIQIGVFQQQGDNLILDTDRFTKEIILTDGARIAADSQGEGSGGAISIQAEDFTLDNQAEILAETTARQDNNTALSEINLGVTNILQLRNDSKISTQALSNADGGNIDINAKFIIAFPSQNEGSDILTRAAQEGTGGDINITAEALFGIEERKATPGNKTNDIDASSQLGLSGQVNITRPDVDPTSGLLELTEEVVDASKLIAQNVCTQTANSEFVDIGKGGLPLNPEYVLTEDTIDVGLVAPVTASSAEIETSKESEEVKPSITRKPPAQGWIWHENGIVELVAYNPDLVGEQRTWDNHRGCQ